MKRFKVFFLIVTLALLSITSLSGCAPKQPQEKPAEDVVF